MEILIVILLTIVVVLIAIAGLSIKLILYKGGKFPNTHVSGNRYLRERGIYCARAQDLIEQRKVKNEINYKEVSLLNVQKND